MDGCWAIYLQCKGGGTRVFSDVQGPQSGAGRGAGAGGPVLRPVRATLKAKCAKGDVLGVENGKPVLSVDSVPLSPRKRVLHPGHTGSK